MISNTNGSALVSAVPSTACSILTLSIVDQRTSTTGLKLEYYPFTLIIICLWLGYIAATFTVLELAAKRRLHSIGGVGSDFFPALLLTIFAQGHSAVTAMHLARLAISTLQNPSIAPKTWAEVFWMTDQNWQGPFGVFETIMGMRTLRTKISSTFIVFTLTALVALLTPSVASRAYPLATIEYQGVVAIRATVLSPKALDFVVRRTQLAVGAGGWISGRAAEEVYRSQAYSNIHDPNETQANKILFSGDLREFNGTIPGLLHYGTCSPMDADRDLQAFARQAVKTGSKDIELFGSWCSARNMTARPVWRQSAPNSAYDFAYAWCGTFDSNTEQDWMTEKNGYTTTIVAWLTATSKNETTQGFVNCTSTFVTGKAELFNNKTYQNFEWHQGFTKLNTTTRQTAFYPPLHAAFSELSRTTKTNFASNEEDISTLRMLGYQLDRPKDGGSNPNETYKHPRLLSDVANSLWRGATHMNAAVNLMGSQEGEVDAVQRFVIAGRRRSLSWIIVLIVLLSTWLTLLVLCTARMYRRTFRSYLDSYAVARLLADMPSLVDGYCAGELIENPRLSTKFERVGDDYPEEDVGHITAGGRVPLDSGRRYGARVKA
jgi:hypothetical protein